MLQRRSALLALGAGLGGLVAGRRDAAAEPLAQDRYGRMAMRLEKTFLQIDVLDLVVIVSQTTADAIAALVRGERYSERLEEEITREVLRTSDAAASVVFLMDVDLDQFIEGARANVKRAFEAGLISREEYERVHRGLPEWYGFLEERGIREGDRLSYRGNRYGLRTLFRDEEGAKLMDMTHYGPEPLGTMLASYYAPGGDFREPLVRSLFDEA